MIRGVEACPCNSHARFFPLLFAAAGFAAPARRPRGPQYEFLAAPQINLSLVYRLDKLTGDVIACKFDLNPEQDRGRARRLRRDGCYRGGDGATKQEPGEYGLVATRHEQEGGVFRVDYRTGALSICYLYFQREKQAEREIVVDQYVVCTPPWKNGSPSPTPQGPTPPQ